MRQGHETPGALLLNVHGDQKKVFPGRRKKWPSQRAGHQQGQEAGALLRRVGARGRSWAEPRFLPLAQGQPQTAGLCRVALGGTGFKSAEEAVPGPSVFPSGEPGVSGTLEA